MSSTTSPEERVRVDKWLWAARCFKTRTMASQACEGGHVKIDGQAVKAARRVRIGETIDVVTPGGRRVLEVKALAERRGPASLAKTLYVDHTPPEEPSDEPPFLREARMGRPTKRDRRRMRKVRGKF